METKEELKRRRLERKARPNVSRVRELRENNNISQRELANIIGVSVPTYCSKEKGRVKITLREAKLLAMFFETNVEDLFFEPILNAI